MSSIYRRLLGVTVSFCLVSTGFAADYGRTTGAFAVSPGGAATYSVPIWTPPGPNHVTPSLSLSYSSQGGNGLAGVGWNLSAVSSIERCARTIAQDGAAAPVDLSMNDRYCMGGNRLRLHSGTYGAATSVYFTEFADYSRVTAYSSQGNGPQYFIVEGKNGLKYEYGKTTSSRVVLGTTVLRWMLNKVYDRNGNNYVVSYNNGSGFAVPDIISWTPTYLGSPIYRYEAKFNYLTSRSDEDAFLGRVAGFDVSNRNRLESIQIKSAGTVVRKYRFAYDTSSATSRSRLISAKECADDAEANCLLPLTFAYQAGQTGISSTAVSGVSSASSLVRGKYDFNGDGKSDLLYVTGSTWKVSFSTGSGYSAAVDTGVSSAAIYLVHRFLATHQDGLLANVAGVWSYVGYNGGAFVTTSTGIAVNSGTIVTDNNGDGIADLVWTTGGSVMLRMNGTAAGATVPSFGSATTAASFSVGQGNVGITNAQTCPVERLCDVNGDGRADLIVNVVSVTGCGMSGCTIVDTKYDLFASGAGGYTAFAQVGAIGYTGVKFNDDRCIDRVPTFTTSLQVAGCNIAAPTTLTLPAAPVVVLDWNGDGNGDILFNNGGFFGVYLSKGNAASPFSSLVTTTVPFSTSCSYFALDADGDGLDDIGCVGSTTPFAFSYYTHNGSGGTYLTQEPDLLNSITDGFGVNISTAYVSTSQNNYTRGTGTQLPLVDATDPVTVVAQVTTSSGVGGTYTKTYTYAGARRNIARGEFAGFQRFDEVDSRNGVIRRSYFEQTFPISGMLSQQEVMQPNGVTPMTRTVFTNGFYTLDATSNNQRYFTYTQGSIATRYEVGGSWNGVLLSTVATANTFDNASGAIYDQTVTTTEPSGANGVTVGGAWTARTYSPLANFLNDTTNWCLGRAGQTQQINSTNLTYGASITRTTNTTWNATYCRPTQVIDEPGNPTLQVTTDLAYDGFGHAYQTTVTGVGMPARTTTTIYSNGTFTTGQFPLSLTNPLGQTSTTSWNYDLGVRTGATDANGIATTWQFDSFGRRIRENRPDGTYSTWSATACGGCDSRVRTLTTQNYYSNGGTLQFSELTFLDQFDRSIYEYRPRIDSHSDVTTRDYDSLGRIYREHFPYPNNGAPVGYVSTTFDLLDRPTAISRPISDTNPTLQTTDIYYEGLTTRTRDALSKYSYKIINAVGQLVRSQDHNGYYQAFEFDSFGSSKRVQDSAGNTLQGSTYNVRGMLTQRVDMDMGTWNFTPNALGETVSQTDGKGQSTTYVYDALSRVISRTEAEGTSTWTWGASSGAKNIGRVASIAGPGYSESYAYDSIGRPSATTISADTTYQIDYSYNSLGSLETLTFPTSTSSYRLKLKYEYSAGQLTRVRDFASPFTNFWTVNAKNSRGQPIQETLGNGLVTNRSIDGVTGWLKSIQTGVGGGTGVQNLVYTWDLAGNLASRKDVNQSNLTETFIYDNVYRLDFSQLNGVTNLDMTYDALGNITGKSDVGSYTYHATKKHQVSATSNGWSFSYDNNGNMTSGRGAATTWFSYNYPASITNGADTASFSYTPDRQYWKQISNYTSGGTATTIYVGGLLEKVMTSAGTDFRHMIRAGGATIIVSRQSSGTNSVNYATTDHLGSSSAITNASGAILVNSSFDAFGKRRGSNWSGGPSAGDWTAIASTTRRGYTDHTMLDNLGLIHMNGRAYDPALGRFISADPRIIETTNGQNYNRYSYVYNNPLRHVDPNGFDAKKTDCRSGGSQCGDAIKAAMQSSSLAAARAAGKDAVREWVNDTVATIAAKEIMSNGCGAMGCQALANHFEAYDRQAGISMFDAFGKGELAAYNVVVDKRTNVNVIKSKTDTVTTQYAFGNGILGSMQRHADLGTLHIEWAKDTVVTEYTLVNNPSHGFWQDIFETAQDKLGFTTDAARLTAHLMQDASSAGRQVEWVVHSQGGAIYAEAMRFAGGGLAGNSVVFDAGANNRWATNAIAHDVGVRVDGYNYSAWDAVPNLIGLNGNPFTMLGSFFASPLLFTDGHSPHTAPTPGWRRYRD